MTYVAVSAGNTGDLLASAERRWSAIAEARPDLAPALSLQRNLLGIVLEIAGVLESGRLPRLSLPPKYLAAKLARGVPALAGEPIPLPVPALARPLVRLCYALADGGAGDAARHIGETIEQGAIEPGS